MLNFLRRLFDCSACNARDYTIAILKEELIRKDAKIQEIEMRNDNLNLDIRHRLDYVTGINRGEQPIATGNMHSVNRSNGIQSRIARAERASYKPELTEQRHKEYEERIAALSRPEIEIAEPEGA